MLPLRRDVLRPGRPLDAARLPEDDDPAVVHLAAYDDADAARSPVGCVTAFPRPEPGTVEGAPAAWQLRMMATDPAVRGQGYGTALLGRLVAEVRSRGGTRLWCNARVAAVGFYTRHGFAVVSEIFEVPGIGPHRRLRRPAAQQ